MPTIRKSKKKDKKLVTMIAEAAILRGIHNPYQFQLATGLSGGKATKLWQGKKNITLAELDLTCNILGCGLDDIVKRVPTSSNSKKI